MQKFYEYVTDNYIHLFHNKFDSLPRFFSYVECNNKRMQFGGLRNESWYDYSYINYICVLLFTLH